MSEFEKKDKNKDFLEKAEDFIEDLIEDIQEFDEKVVLEVQETRSPEETRLWKVITFIGLPYVWIGLAIIFFILGIYHGAIIIGFAGLSHRVIVIPLKKIARRERPSQEEPKIKPLVVTKHFSFPSGHTYVASVMGLSLGFSYANPWIIILAYIIAGLVAFSRIYLGAHYLTDVLVSILIASIVALIISLFYPIIESWHYMIANLFYWSS